MPVSVRFCSCCTEASCCAEEKNAWDSRFLELVSCRIMDASVSTADGLFEVSRPASDVCAEFMYAAFTICTAFFREVM